MERCKEIIWYGWDGPKRPDPPACPVCGRPTKWRGPKRGWDKYCSLACVGIARRKIPRDVEPPRCPTCGAPVPWTGKGWAKYCSRRCYGQAMRKPDSTHSYALTGGVPMSKALTAAQCRDMRRFLLLCLTAGSRAQQTGGKVDVGELIRQWRAGEWDHERPPLRSWWPELVEAGV